MALAFGSGGAAPCAFAAASHDDPAESARATAASGSGNTGPSRVGVGPPPCIKWHEEGRAFGHFSSWASSIASLPTEAPCCFGGCLASVVLNLAED